MNIHQKQSQGADRARPVIWMLGALSIAAAAAFWPPAYSAAEPAVSVPAPKVDEAAHGASETAVLAGGCFWGVQAVFQHVKGVNQALSGYSGGGKATAAYELVGTGQTGHAESVRISFDPRVISYGKILQIYFSVATDPTQLNHQGADVGSQYRSVIFATNDKQKDVARAYIAQLNQAGVYGRPVVTKVDPLTGFYPAEAYHQDFATLHPDNAYIANLDLPKVENLHRMFPALYRPQAKLVGNGGAAY